MRAAVTADIVPPGQQGVPYSLNNTLDLSGTATDINAIETTVGEVNQKTGVDVNAVPNLEVAETNVTAIDGTPVNTTVSSVTDSAPSRRSFQKRGLSRRSKRDTDVYHQVFAGTGPAGGFVNDASIEGTAYLTYTVVSNATYNVDACLTFCTSIPG